MTGCGFKLNNLASTEKCQQVIPSNPIISCQGNICTAAIMDKNHPENMNADVELSQEEIWKDAFDFLQEYYNFHSKSGLEKRLEEVKQQIFSAQRTYSHTYDELVFGVQTAWRNSSRCIYRIQWRNIHLLDCRDVKTPMEMFDACVNHLRFATNGGNIKSTITLFPPRKRGTRGPRIWNPQLIRYAGYLLEDGSVLGDPAQVEITKVCLRLGWNPPCPKSKFDVLPLICEFDGKWICQELPQDSVLQVPIEHPDISSFKELGIKWHAVPAISSMAVTIGGIIYSAAPFNGWYMSAEIGARNLSDEQRYNLLPDIASLLKLSQSNRSLWKDRALVELNLAVIHSFDKNGISIVDHHSASEAFMAHFKMDSFERGFVPGDWIWLVPPLSGSATSVFHQEMVNIFLKPNFIPFKEASHLILHSENSGILRMDQKRSSGVKRLDLSENINSVKIYYATETGTSLIYANKIKSRIEKLFDTEIQLVRMKGSPQSLVTDRNQNTFAIIVTSTFGNGEPPIMARGFCSDLRKHNYFLEGLQFAIFGLCSSSYATYNECALNVSKRLKSLGALEAVDVGYGDEMKDRDSIFESWMSCLILVLQGIKPDPSSMPKSPVKDLIAIRSIFADYSKESFDVKAISELVAGHVFHLEIQCSRELEYSEGDHFSVLPANSDDSVQMVLKALSLSFDDTFPFGMVEDGVKVGLLLKYMTNLDAMPDKTILKFYLNEMEQISDHEDKDFYKHICFLKYLLLHEDADMNYQVRDLIVDSSSFYKVFHVSELFSILPVMLPRTYSIASSMSHSSVSAKELHLTVKLAEYEKNSKICTGKCSGYLTSLRPGDLVMGCIKECSRFQLPKSLFDFSVSHRLVFIGNGTGIAPFRGFIQRVGKTVPWLLLYGVRDEESFLYKNEFEPYMNTVKGDQSVIVVYSRSGDKNYVQDLIQEDTRVGQLLKMWAFTIPATSIFVCGSHAMGSAVYEKFEILLGSEKIEEMKSNGKYLEDTY